MADYSILVAGVALGLGSSVATTVVQERLARRRISLERAVEVEGAALVELQDLLVQLPDAWMELMEIDERADEHGGYDGDDVYQLVTKQATPWRRAQVLASRIVDDQTRDTVLAAIAAAWPQRPTELMATMATKPFPKYDWREAASAADRATQAIGARLRRPAR